MKKLLQPASLLLYLLSVVLFFLVGMLFAKFSGAAEGQGLAGGAIVLMNGILFAGVALVGSLIAAYNVSKVVVIKVNKVLYLLVAILVIYLVIEYQTRT